MKRSMSDKLINLIDARAATAVAIVGMTKNVGKTVTLNCLIDRYAAARRILGLVSAGYDGERFDRLTLKDKPRIHVPAGALWLQPGPVSMLRKLFWSRYTAAP